MGASRSSRMTSRCAIGGFIALVVADNQPNFTHPPRRLKNRSRTWCTLQAGVSNSRRACHGEGASLELARDWRGFALAIIGWDFYSETSRGNSRSEGPCLRPLPASQTQ